MQKASLKLFLAAMQSRIVGEEEAFLDTFEEDEDATQNVFLQDNESK